MIRYLTAGESHGPALNGIIDGLPAGLPVDVEYINRELRRRQQGYGRGGRMKIESDTVQVLSGVRFGQTTGAPVTLRIDNRDWENWLKRMSAEPTDRNDRPAEVTIPRPGHADLAGAVKYGHTDIRNVIERASARETAIRTAIGAVAKLFLQQFGIEIGSHVLNILSAHSTVPFDVENVRESSDRADKSPVRSLDPEAETAMISAIDTAKENGDTAGGTFQVIASGVPVGLGSFMQADRKLDGRIAGAMMEIPAIKAVGIGMGRITGEEPGSAVQDPIVKTEVGVVTRASNNAGGIEGGVSNGMPIFVSATMKPISSLIEPLDSVDMQTKEPVKSRFERSDVCAVPAASVVGEAALALVLLEAFTEKFGGDHMDDIRFSFENRRTL